MPRYDMKCKKCGREVERICSVEELDAQKCECGGKLYVVFKQAPGLSIFKPTYFEGIDFYAETKQELKDYCKRNNINWYGE